MKSLKQAEKKYTEKDRIAWLKRTKRKPIDYKKMEEDFLEMMGPPPTEKERAFIQNILKKKSKK